MNLRLDVNDIWHKFIYFAFERSDFFSLKNYDWSDDSSLNYSYNCLNEQLSEYKIDKSDSFSNGVWGEYTISYYQCNYFSMKIVMEIANICEMIFPKLPEDISFYKDNKKWFESITHDEYWKVLDTKFLEELKNQLV